MDRMSSQRYPTKCSLHYRVWWGPIMTLLDPLVNAAPPHYSHSHIEGRRYRRQDEIGTPYCIVIDFETLQDKAVTIRHRDSMKQIRCTPKTSRASLVNGPVGYPLKDLSTNLMNTSKSSPSQSQIRSNNSNKEFQDFSYEHAVDIETEPLICQILLCVVAAIVLKN